MKKTKTTKLGAKRASAPIAIKPAAIKSPDKAPVKATAKIAAKKRTAATTTSSRESDLLRHEIAAFRTQLSKHMAPVTTGSLDEVDALRRVLNDLMEARMNNVIRDLVTIRTSAANAGGEARRIADQMDALLADLGAMKFEAERLEHVDPLIHTVSREVSNASFPDGIIMETLRPGFHTSRGIVVAKALVMVNRRS